MLSDRGTQKFYCVKLVDFFVRPCMYILHRMQVITVDGIKNVLCIILVSDPIQSRSRLPVCGSLMWFLWLFEQQGGYCVHTSINVRVNNNK